MARVVLIHGAFNELWGPNALKARWMPALRDGLWHHGVEIDDTDVGVCFWGDLFRPQPNSESELQIQRSHLGAADSLRSLPDHNVIAALGQAANEAAHERTIEMLRIIVTTPDLRARMRARAEAVITDNTRVIVAHSIGTLLAYTALCNSLHWRVHTLVTLGSPLALPSIFQFLEPPPINDMGQWPGSIEGGRTFVRSATKPQRLHYRRSSDLASRRDSSITVIERTIPSLSQRCCNRSCNCRCSRVIIWGTDGMNFFLEV